MKEPVNSHKFAPYVGKTVNLREVQESDSAFILRLRTTGRGSRFLHQTENSLEKQVQYIRRYLSLPNEWYFIVEDKEGHPLGTVGIYDLQEDSVSIGHWVMDESATLPQSIEGDLLVKDFAFRVLGFDKIRCDTLLSNRDVIRFNSIWHMTIVGRNDELVFYELSKEEYKKHRDIFAKICQGESRD